MKKYLKMADWFSGMTEPQITDYVYDGGMGYGESEAAAHAINSHDELVAMNKELLEVLGRVVGDVKALANQSYGVYGLHQNGDIAPWHSLFAGGFFESWLLSIDDAEAAIEKAKGGKK